jgi:DNA-binding IclR family transcriptional regulator
MPRQQRLTPDGLDGLDAGLAVLETFRTGQAALTLGEISHRLGLSKSRVFRILRTLKRRGFAEQVVRGGPYQLGRKVVEVAQAAGQGFTLLEAAAPVLAALSQALRGTVVLRILDGVEQLTLDCVHSPEVLRTSFPVGARLPATYGSTGKALLAFRPRAVTGDILARCPPAGEVRGMTPRLADYRRELERVRAAGFALNLEESVAGVRSVGAPVLDGDGMAAAAIAISFPVAALPRTRIREVARHLCASANEIGIRLGYAHAPAIPSAGSRTGRRVPVPGP